MSPLWVVLVYGSSVLLAVLLLYFFHSRSWYWHIVSAALAIALGLIPLPAEWAGPKTDLLVGFLFLLLLVWGLAAPLFRLKLSGR
jgi:hypothetical protein